MARVQWKFLLKPIWPFLNDNLLFMYGNKKIKAIWTVISVVMIIGMIAMSFAPAFY